MEYKECQTCQGYCCYHNDFSGTPLTDNDITRIAKYLDMPREAFIERYVILLKGKIRYLEQPEAVGKIKAWKVCPFLSVGVCAIHRVKPKICKAAKPVYLGNGISCSDYHKSRVGWVK